MSDSWMDASKLMWMVVDDQKNWIPLGDTVHNEIEINIIGNIFQNQELLK